MKYITQCPKCHRGTGDCRCGDIIPNGSDIALTRTITVCPHPNVVELYQGSEGTIMAYMGVDKEGQHRYGVRFGKWETVINQSWFGVINLAEVPA